jgi:hypothetical protein
VANFRLIFIKVQMALLQEAMPTFRSVLEQGQSGFCRGTDSPALLLHEVCSLRLLRLLCTWYALGDFQKAFPRTWREDLICIINRIRPAGNGVVALLADVLRNDVVAVWLSGCSDMDVVQGIPEDGNVGTLTYVHLPDTLIEELNAHNLGVGVDVRMPQAWDGHVWAGTGAPISDLVFEICHCIMASSPLPTPELLVLWPDLEASAARALDLLSPWRLAALFHVDDLVFLGSSKGTLEETLDVVVNWATRHNARFHHSEAKTVTMVACHPSARDLVSTATVTMMCPERQMQRVEVHRRDSHKWLGVIWPQDLRFTAELGTKVTMSKKEMGKLAGFVQTGALPLHLALPITNSKVDSLLTLSRVTRRSP